MIVAQQCVPLQPDALRQQLEAWQARWPSLGVMALVPEAEHAQVAVLQATANALNVALVGAVFPALVTDTGFATSGVCLLCFAQAPAYVLADQLEQQGDVRLAHALQDLLRGDAAEPLTLFTVFDAMVPNIGSLMESVHLALDGERHYVGVSAGSETFQPMSCLFDNQRLVGNGVLALLLPDAPKAVVRHGYAVSKSLCSATSAVGNRIALIDDRPAFSVYQEVIRQEYGVALTAENFYELAVHFPFGVVTAVDVLVRIPVSLGEDGSLYCVGEIPERSMLRLLSAPRWEHSSCVADIQDELAVAGVPGQPASLLTFYCAGRRMHFGTHAADELAQLRQASGCSAMFGALSLGEMDSLEEFMFPRFHNAAIVCMPQPAA